MSFTDLCHWLCQAIFPNLVLLRYSCITNIINGICVEQVFLVGAGFVRFVIAAAIEQRIIDAFGKKKPIIFADVMIVVGALLTGRPPSRIFLVIGRVFVELGFLLSVGAFRSYIEDAAMAKLLVGICTFFEIVGDLLSTCLNLAFKVRDKQKHLLLSMHELTTYGGLSRIA